MKLVLKRLSFLGHNQVLSTVNEITQFLTVLVLIMPMYSYNTYN